MTSPFAGVVLVLVAALVLSSVTKILDRQAAADTFAALRVPRIPPTWAYGSCLSARCCSRWPCS